MKPARTAALVVCICILGMLGCGDSVKPRGCDYAIRQLYVFPPTLTADHNAVPPANQASYTAYAQFDLSGFCTSVNVDFGPVLTPVTWDASDLTKVSLSTDHGTLTATCLTSAVDPVAIKATAVSTTDPSKTFTATSTLICR